MSRVEARVRKEEREKHDVEHGDMKRQMEAEIMELQANLKRLQKVCHGLTLNTDP